MSSRVTPCSRQSSGAGTPSGPGYENTQGDVSISYLSVQFRLGHYTISNYPKSHPGCGTNDGERSPPQGVLCNILKIKTKFRSFFFKETWCLDDNTYGSGECT